MKCLVLGGGGFLGSHLVDALLGAGHYVRVFERPNLSHYRVFRPEESVEWLEGDFVNGESVRIAIEGCEVIFHLASTTLPRPSNDNPAYDVATNVGGTLNVLELARDAGVRRVIFSSSGGTVYGVPGQIPISESHPTDPICSYGITKLAIEKYLHLYRQLHGLDYCVLRLANPYGERQRISTAQGAVAVFLHRALHQLPIEIWGDGSVVRDYFHVSDAVAAFLRALDYEGSRRIFNIGSGESLSLNQLLAEIELLLGRPVRRRYIAGRSFDVPANVLDISAARDELGWRPQISFADGMARTLAWMQQKG
jgi:UDP-glucose 4-epimerase